MSATVYSDCKIATMRADLPGYGLIADGALAVSDGVIAWVGARADLPSAYSDAQTETLNGALVTPALIDCHTHLVFGGDRAEEFEMRLKGASYEEIARAGGGIVSTVNATRNASDDDLLNSALRRLDDLIAEGVAIVEIKSGYGLTIDDEIRMLKTARRLGKERPVKIVTTWLAAHALPPEYKEQPDRYIDDVVIPGLERAHSEGLVDAVDGFCETIGFSPEQIARVFHKARALGLPIKLHAEQLSDQKGALLAARNGALSVDHLEYVDEGDIAEIAAAGCVAVMLPCAFYTLKEEKLPPIEAFRKHGVDMALATDCNPGSSPVSSILTAMNMACTEFAMTPEETLAGATRNAAKALGLSGQYGVIADGAAAELAVWDVHHPAALSYWIGGSPLQRRISAMERRR